MLNDMKISTRLVILLVAFMMFTLVLEGVEFGSLVYRGRRASR